MGWKQISRRSRKDFLDGSQLSAGYPGGVEPGWYALRNLHSRDWSRREIFRIEDDHFAAVVSVDVCDEGQHVAVVFIDRADSLREWRLVRGAAGSEQIFLRG